MSVFNPLPQHSLHPAAGYMPTMSHFHFLWCFQHGGLFFDKLCHDCASLILSFSWQTGEFNPQAVYVGFWVDKAHLGQIFFTILWFPWSFTISYTNESYSFIYCQYCVVQNAGDKNKAREKGRHRHGCSPPTSHVSSHLTDHNIS